jgi:riboflavin biosynthesis pyrimidine reductase
LEPVVAAGPIEPLERVFEVEDLPRLELPSELARVHDGNLGFAADCLYANFVATIDGAVAIPGMRGSNTFIADDSDPDRFLMGMLRAFADAVLIGAGVMRASPRGTWRAAQIYPPAAADYGQLRERLGIAPDPEVAVLTGHGSIDPGHPLFEAGALVLTSDSGAARLAGRLPAATTVLTFGESTTIDIPTVVGTLRERGHRRILCEAGPHTFGELVGADLVDELFLTRSPLLVGNAGPGSRFGLIEETDLTPTGRHGRLLSVRRHGSHVFERYALERA